MCEYYTKKTKQLIKINIYLLSLIPTKTKIYYSYNIITSLSVNLDELNHLYLPEYLHTLNFNGLPPHEL